MAACWALSDSRPHMATGGLTRPGPDTAPANRRAIGSSLHAHPGTLRISTHSFMHAPPGGQMPAPSHDRQRNIIDVCLILSCVVLLSSTAGAQQDTIRPS